MKEVIIDDIEDLVLKHTAEFLNIQGMRYIFMANEVDVDISVKMIYGEGI